MLWTPFPRGEFPQLRGSKSLFQKYLSLKSRLKFIKGDLADVRPPALDSRIQASTEGPRYEQNIWCSGRPRLRFFAGFPLQFDLLSKSSQSRKRHSRSKGADLALRVHTFVIGRR
jgi:hypothetical protein